MNEELKIIIKAITKPAETALQDVRKELDGISVSADKSGKSVNVAMKSISKGATIAIGSIVALTTAMVALGKSSLEYQKIQAKLVAGFQSVGLGADKANQIYGNLFSFLGKADTAGEAAALLAQLTQNEEDLTEWTQILQGVYATFGDSLPVETLAEAVNHSANLGEVQGTLADALEWSGINVEAFNAKLAMTSSVAEREALIRGTLNGLYMNASKIYSKNNQALIQYHQSQMAVDQALAQATQYVIPLMTALNNLAATLLNVLRPAFENISAVLVAFVQWVMAGIKAIGSFFGVFDGEGASGAKAISSSIGAISTGTTQIATGVNKVGDAFVGATKEAEKLKRQVMGFDELNVVSPQQTATSDAGGSNGLGIGGIEDITIPEIDIPSVSIGSVELPGLDDFEEKVAKIKEYLDPIAVLVGIIGTGLAAWKIADFLGEVKYLYQMWTTPWPDLKLRYNLDTAGLQSKMNDVEIRINGLKEAAKLFAGELLIAAGSLATVYGYSDSWVNGLDWAGLATTFGGLAAVVGGVLLAFGPIPAQIAAVAAGIAAVVLAVKDFTTQGPTLENSIGILGGAAAIGVALGVAFGPIVGIIAGVVAAIAGFTAAIILEEPAIKSVEDAQNALNEAKEKARQVENDYINAVDAAEAALKRLEKAEEAAGMTGEDLYELVKNGTLDYADMTDAQKELYKAYLDNEQKQKDLKATTEAFEEAKKAETIASYENQLALAKESGNYDEYKKSVVDAFKKGELSAEEARDLLEKAMSEMSNDSQQTFMKDIPGDIKNGLDPHKYESTWTKMKKGFANFWQGCKDVFKDVGDWFADLGKDMLNGLINVINNYVIGFVEDEINKYIRLINGVISLINMIPGINIGHINEVVLARIPTNNDTSIRKSNIPIGAGGLPRIRQMATGGIVTGSTFANIGEAGAEAVLPLENNTEWMDLLADRIAARNSTPTKIVLKVGERELGQATIKSINQITKQTGGLQLQLV